MDKKRKSRAFWKGFTSVLSFPSKKIEGFSDCVEEALAKDWEAVGNDMRRAIDKVSGTRRIGDLPVKCTHPLHDPATFRVYEPGVYEHVCPGCFSKMIFTIDPGTLSVKR